MNYRLNHWVLGIYYFLMSVDLTYCEEILSFLFCFRKQSNLFISCSIDAKTLEMTWHFGPSKLPSVSVMKINILHFDKQKLIKLSRNAVPACQYPVVLILCSGYWEHHNRNTSVTLSQHNTAQCTVKPGFLYGAQCDLEATMCSKVLLINSFTFLH